MGFADFPDVLNCRAESVGRLGDCGISWSSSSGSLRLSLIRLRVSVLCKLLIFLGALLLLDKHLQS